MNDYCCEGGDRNVRVDRLEVRTALGELVAARELEELDAVETYCEPRGDYYWLAVNCSVDVAINVPSDGDYVLDIFVWGEQAGGELPRLVVDVESESVLPAAEAVLKEKLVELHDKLLGVQVNANSPDVQATFALWVDAWQRGRRSNADDRWNTRCDWDEDEPLPRRHRQRCPCLARRLGLGQGLWLGLGTH